MPSHRPPLRRYISLDSTFSLSFAASVTAQDIKNAQLDLANRMLQGVSTNYVDQTTNFREIKISEQNLPAFTDMLNNGTLQFTLSRCDKAFAGYSSIRVSEVGSWRLGHMCALRASTTVCREPCMMRLALLARSLSVPVSLAP